MKRATEEYDGVEIEAPIGKVSKREGPIKDKQTLMEDEKRRIEALYADLPPLPPKVPHPDYLIQDQPKYSRDKASLAFYSVCAAGSFPEVRNYSENARPSHADRQYGLEKAAHAFQIETVRYSMQEQSTKVHTRVFRTCKDTGPAVQNLFGDSSIINQYLWAETRLPLKGNARARDGKRICKRLLDDRDDALPHKYPSGRPQQD